MIKYVKIMVGDDMRAKRINKDSFKKILKNRNFLIAVCVGVLTIISIGVTYSSFFSVKTNTASQSLTTGTLSVSYGSETSSILRSNLSSLSNELGMEQDDYSIVYIQNTGSLNSTFTLNIGYDMESFTGRDSYKVSDALTPIDYIMIAVYEYNGVGKEDTLVVGPVSVADLPIYKVGNTTDYRYNRYSILFDVVGSISSEKATKTYKIKTWLSDKAIPSASFTYFYVNTEVVAEVENAKMAYNLSGVLKDSSNNILTNATIKVQNGSIIANTNSSGEFNINGLYPGVYNIEVTANDKTVTGNLIIEEGNNISVTNLGTTFTDSNIFDIAHKYGTTVSKLLIKNNIETYSVAATISGGSLPSISKIIGDYNENITNLLFQINVETNTFQITK